MTSPSRTDQDGGVEDAHPQPVASGRVLSWPAIARGGLVTLVLLFTASVAQSIVDHNVTDFEHSGWIYPFFVAVLLSYAYGGSFAGASAPEAPLSNGALAGIAGFVAWLPLRIAIWLVRDEHRGIFTGTSPILRPGQIFGHIVIAAGLGMLGGLLGARAAARRARASTASSPASSPGSGSGSTADR